MEEFRSGGSQPQNQDTTEPVIRPSEKQVTIEPIHDNIMADPLSDTQIANNHINNPAIGNIEVDREATGVNVTGSTERPQVTAQEILARRGKKSGGARKAVLALFVIVLLAALGYVTYMYLLPK